MENWVKDLNDIYSKYERNVKIPFDRVKKIVRKILENDRERDKLQELLDFVKESKTNTDILYRYVRNNTTCQSPRYTNMCYDLGIPIHTKEAEILAILEDYFKEHPKSE